MFPTRGHELDHRETKRTAIKGAETEMQKDLICILDSYPWHAVQNALTDCYSLGLVCLQEPTC